MVPNTKRSKGFNQALCSCGLFLRMALFTGGGNIDMGSTEIRVIRRKPHILEAIILFTAEPGKLTEKEASWHLLPVRLLDVAKDGGKAHDVVGKQRDFGESGRWSLAGSEQLL
jgi:hypothetical protein